VASRRLNPDLVGFGQAASRLDKRLQADTGLTEEVEKMKELLWQTPICQA